MKAGNLRHIISIQRPVQTTDSHGGPVTAWETVYTVRASIEPLQGRSLIAAQAINSETTGRICIRYQSGITASMRVLFGSRIFNITAPPINQDERNRELVLFTSEGLNEG